MGIVHQINVKPHHSKERGIPKHAVESVDVTVHGLSGDYNVYRTEKKDRNPDTAVSLLPLELLQEFQRESWPIQPGHLGENVTTLGLPYETIRVGDIYLVGNVHLEITDLCQPCTGLQVLPYVGPDRITNFMRTLRDHRGWYAKVLQEGRIQRGDSIELYV